MPSYSEFFLASRSSVIQFETLEISHPSFTRTFRIVRNTAHGLTATDGVEMTFDYYPCRIRGIGRRDNLDYGLEIDVGDLGEVLPREMDAIMTAGTFKTKPTVKYRTWRSDDLSAPLFGPIELEVRRFNFNESGASFEAAAPALNTGKTGRQYTIDLFPSLRGFL